jgi:hypothetical protein
MKITTTLKYSLGHIIKDYLKIDLFCPHCGKQELWESCGGGDYYVGVESLCINCGCVAYLDPCGSEPSEDPSNKARILQIKTALEDLK